MAKQNTARKDEPTENADWTVIDKNAEPGSSRIHEPVKGFRYPLMSNERTKMPQAHAVKFLNDVSFEVRDPEGNVVAPVPQNAQLRTGEKVPTLQRNETIATFDELTDDALLRRAQLRPGGENLGRDESREGLIKFLTGPEKPKLVRGKRPESLPSVDGEEEVAAEEMGADEAADILGGR